MAENVMTTTGRFVWHDLMTTDLEASLGFYRQLFGWTVEEQDMGGKVGKYTMLKAGDRGIGGMVPMDPSQGVPSHWIGYVTVDDVDAATSKVKELGGTVAFEGMDIPGVGRFAVIGDSGGAYVSPFKAMQDMPEPEGPMPTGAVVWNELLAKDTEQARRFYTGVFGWSVREMDMGPMGVYHMFRSGDKDRAGMMRMPPGAAGPQSWLCYFGVDDVDAAASKVGQLGGKLHVQPSDIPNVGRFSVCQDVTGSIFALFKSSSQG